MQLILASNSERRKNLLNEMGLDFIQVPSFVSELGNEVYFNQVATINAFRKAEDIALKYPDDLVIGADTVIEFNNNIIGKPENLTDAKRILLSLSGAEHFVVSGVCLRSVKQKIRCTFAVKTKVIFKEISKQGVKDYLSKVHVLDKAGAYAIQEYGEMIVESIDGPLDNVIGLPCKALQTALDAIYKL